MFANILLGRIARLVWFYFGTTNIPSLRSHKKLYNNFSRYAKLKKLSVSQKLENLINKLRNRIGIYRDDFVVHGDDPRKFSRILRATTWNFNTSNSSIATHLIYPKNTREAQKSSGDMLELNQLIDEYIKEISVFLENNSDKVVCN